jgi:hypothetical protein
MQYILEYLTFDGETGNIVNIQYYFDASGINVRPVNPTDPYYINPINNIYDKFINNLNSKTINNMAILNYIPFLTIRDFCSEFYNFIKYEGENTQTDFKNIMDCIYLFDFRDLDEYDINDYDIDTQDIIKDNLVFKYDLYKQIILKCLLKINRNRDKINSTPDKDYHIQVFDGNIFKLADKEYLDKFSDTYLNTSNVSKEEFLETIAEQGVIRRSVYKPKSKKGKSIKMSKPIGDLGMLQSMSEADTETVPAKPTTKPGTKPGTRPAHPGKKPFEGPNPDPKASQTEIEKAKNDVLKLIQGILRDGKK